MTSSVRQVSFKDPGAPGFAAYITTTLPSTTLQGSTLIVISTVSCYANTQPQANQNGPAGSPGATGDLTNGQYTPLVLMRDSNTSATQAIAMYVLQNAAAVTSGTQFVANFTAVDDYIGIIAIEVTGVAANSLVAFGNTVISVAGAGTNNLTTGNVALGSNPVIVLGLASADLNSNLPNAGTGTTSQGQGWGWGSANGARLVSQNFSNPGTAGVAQSSVAADEYLVLSIALADSSGTTPTQFKIYANGAMQAHSFQQATLPSGMAMRLYSNNTVHAASIVSDGGGKMRLYSNGTLQVNSTITV